MPQESWNLCLFLIFSQSSLLLCLFFPSIWKINNYRASYSSLNHSKKKLKEANRSKLYSHGQQEIDDKWQSGFGDREAGNSWFSLHGDRNTIFTLIPLFSSSRTHGLGEVESLGEHAKAYLLIWTFICSKLSPISSELNWVSSWLPTLSTFAPFEKEGIRPRRNNSVIYRLSMLCQALSFRFFISLVHLNNLESLVLLYPFYRWELWGSKIKVSSPRFPHW